MTSFLMAHSDPCLLAAGRTTTNEELEDMLESGKLAIFTDDVRVSMAVPYVAGVVVVGSRQGGHL